MAYNLIITDRADELIDKLASYLLNKLKNPEAAIHFMDDMEDIYDRLEENPYLFPESKDSYLCSKGYREAVLSSMSYRVVFRVNEKTVYIVGVYHDLEDYAKKVER
ncbi:MAG: type II toxin-antitoxin system RelE/ParE family toxin [Lachnospiraceae bacterium]|nr:type II toxin-antitoxin system RelE/ParE family toxin [Lachnospiraceae bacterium]